MKAPQGRASSQSLKLLTVSDWYGQLCSAVGEASEVELGSYMYDNVALHQTLLRRLRGRASFSLSVYIDAGSLKGKTPKMQKPRLEELLAAGAKVFRCGGVKASGLFHCKAAVVDRRYLYTGSANFTENSRGNEELCFKITGPVVHDVLEKLNCQKLKGKPWNGS